MLSLTLPVFAERSVVEYLPVDCIRGGELPLLQVKVRGEGELRAYFRRINTTDWCSVEGVNEGPLSRVVLPKFEDGDEIEFFFVLLDGRRVVARSPKIFRARVTPVCETAWARHILRLSLSCGQDAEAIPSAVAAGQSIDPELVDEVPPQGSPDTPAPQPPPGN